MCGRLSRKRRHYQTSCFVTVHTAEGQDTDTRLPAQQGRIFVYQWSTNTLAGGQMLLPAKQRKQETKCERCTWPTYSRFATGKGGIACWMDPHQQYCFLGIMHMRLLNDLSRVACPGDCAVREVRPRVRPRGHYLPRRLRQVPPHVAYPRLGLSLCRLAGPTTPTSGWPEAWRGERRSPRRIRVGEQIQAAAEQGDRVGTRTHFTAFYRAPVAYLGLLVEGNGVWLSAG